MPSPPTVKSCCPCFGRRKAESGGCCTTLTDQVMGEIPHMRYIDDFDVLEEPRAEPSILLSQLPGHLKERGLELSIDPEAYLESYLGYETKPNKNPDADWRLDVMAGLYQLCAAYQRLSECRQ